MRIGFIGAGNVGGALARQFTALGHDVLLSNSRGPETLAGLVEELGPRAEAVTSEEALQRGELVVITVSLGTYRTLPVDGSEGKTLIDTCNYYPERDGHIEALDSKSAGPSELIQGHFAKANVVKAFNQIPAQAIIDDARAGDDPTRRAIPIAGDAVEAKREVMQLIHQIGFDPVDAGPLTAGRLFDNGTPLYGAALSEHELRAAVSA